MLLLRVGLVQAGQDEDDGPVRLVAADDAQVLEDVLLGVVQRLDRDDDDVGLVVEAGQVLGGVVAGLVEAARVEERQERGLGGGKLVLARKARAGLKALADLGVVAPVRYLMSEVLPLCVLPNSQKTGTGNARAKLSRWA